LHAIGRRVTPATNAALAAELARFGVGA